MGDVKAVHAGGDAGGDRVSLVRDGDGGRALETVGDAVGEAES